MTAHRLLLIRTLTPLHMGAESGSGFIDKPVMRERHTGWPLIPGTAIKGVIADSHNAADDQRAGDDKAEARAAFGVAHGSGHTGNDNSGALIFTDARLLVLPVRSFAGTTAFVTSPAALQRFGQELRMFSGECLPESPQLCLPVDIAMGEASVLGIEQHVLLEDLWLQPPAESDAAAVRTAVDGISAWFADRLWEPEHALGTMFRQRFALVSDAIFDAFCASALEVRSRVRINPDTGVVDEGKLWFEELVGEQAVFVAHVFCERVFTAKEATPKKEDPSRPKPPTTPHLLSTYCSKTTDLQFGGTGSVGRGRCRVAFIDAHSAALKAADSEQAGS